MKEITYFFCSTWIEIWFLWNLFHQFIIIEQRRIRPNLCLKFLIQRYYCPLIKQVNGGSIDYDVIISHTCSQYHTNPIFYDVL